MAGYRWDKQKTIGEHKRIYINFLAKNGYLEPGAIKKISWVCGGEPSGDILAKSGADAVTSLLTSPEHAIPGDPVTADNRPGFFRKRFKDSVVDKFPANRHQWISLFAWRRRGWQFTAVATFAISI